MHEAITRRKRIYSEGTERSGFVLPVAVLALLLMTMLAVAGLLASSDEFKSARAMRDGNAAFYAAEAGFNVTYANWDTTFQSQVDSIEPGDSLVLGWTSLMGGSRYRPTIHRWHIEGQAVYRLTVVGEGPGPASGQRTLSYALTAGPSQPGQHLKLGNCCDAAVTMRGEANLEDDTSIDGHDSNPAGWGDACQNDLYDKPGLVMEDTTLLQAESSVTINGEPGLAEGDWINDATFEQFGDLSWDEIGEMATKVFEDTEPTPRPSTKIDPVTGEEVCDYDDPLNLGSPDPDHPCFDYFPIVLIRDEVHFDGSGYAQGVYVLDMTTATLGSEFDIEDDMVFNGIVLGKGCVEVQDRSRYHGAMFVDSKYWGEAICNTDVTFDMHRDDATLRYSTCAIDRALIGTGLDEWAEAQVPGSSGDIELLGSRSFGEQY